MSFLRTWNKDDVDPLLYGADKEMAELLFNVGLLGITRSMFKEAVDVFAALRVIRPKSEAPLIGIAMAAMVQLNYDAAIATLLNGALELNPDSLTAKSLLGLALREGGHAKESEMMLKEVIEQGDAEDPAVKMAHDFLAVKKN